MNWVDKTRWRIEQLGWSLRVLADKSSVPYNYVKSALSSKSEPGSSNGIKIAIALGFDPAWLFDDNQDMSTVKYLNPSENNATSRIGNLDNLFDNKDLMLLRDLEGAIDFLGPGDPGIIDLYRIALVLVKEKYDRVDTALYGPLPDDATTTPARNSADKLRNHH